MLSIVFRHHIKYKVIIKFRIYIQDIGFEEDIQ